MRTVYGVEHIEVEFGERPFGWRLYDTLEQCVAETKAASKSGDTEGQYIGPRRPLECFLIPYGALSARLKADINLNGEASTDDNWWPKFKGSRIAIS